MISTRGASGVSLCAFSSFSAVTERKYLSNSRYAGFCSDPMLLNGRNRSAAHSTAEKAHAERDAALQRVEELEKMLETRWIFSVSNNSIYDNGIKIIQVIVDCEMRFR